MVPAEDAYEFWDLGRQEALAVEARVDFDMNPDSVAYSRAAEGGQALEARDGQTDLAAHRFLDASRERIAQNEDGFRDPGLPERHRLDDRIHAQPVRAQPVHGGDKVVQPMPVGVGLGDGH